MQELTTIDEVLSALGGPLEIVKITGMKYKAAFALKYGAVFPSKYYLVMIDALARAGKTAPSSLWGMKESEQQAS